MLSLSLLSLIKKFITYIEEDISRSILKNEKGERDGEVSERDI